jgi:hypothetical protein
MAGFQTDVLDHVAQVIGGTANAGISGFFDGTPLTGLNGCWSIDPGAIFQTPTAVVLPGSFVDSLLGGQGKEEVEDEVKILLLLTKYSTAAQFSVLTPFRDTVPAAFRAHMQAFSMPDVIDCFITKGTSGIHNWSGVEYLAWDFTCRVRRLLSVSYAA